MEIARTVVAGIPFEIVHGPKPRGMTLAEMRVWRLAFDIAHLEAAGGEYDFETGEVTEPPGPKKTAEDEVD